MIIDVHHHTIKLTLDEKAIEIEAERRWAVFSGGNRAHAIDVTIDEIKRRLSATAPDPHGEKLLERMAKVGIDVTVMVVTDNITHGQSDEECLATNHTYAEIGNASHGKILTLAGVDPRRKNAPELLRRCMEEYGMRGLKWHPGCRLFTSKSRGLRGIESSGTTRWSINDPYRAKYKRLHLASNKETK